MIIHVNIIILVGYEAFFASLELIVGEGILSNSS